MKISEAQFVPPNIPPLGFLNIMNNYDTANLNPYFEFLHSLRFPENEMSQEVTAIQCQFHLPPAHQEAFNKWLCSLLPAGEPVPRLCSVLVPEPNDCSLLARCARYAQSYAEREVCWAIHPAHIALIMERTDQYGNAIAGGDGGAGLESQEFDLFAMKEFFGRAG